jgi:ABC-type Fe3+-hydroxamate transport system substrate-binding protein
MRRAALPILLAGLALTVSACGERPEPTGPNVKLFPVSVSPPGGSPITLPQAPARVAAVGPPSASLVTALEQGARNAPRILRANDAGDARLESFHPDLVIATSSVPRTSAPVYSLPQDSIRDAEHGIVDVGSLLGRPLAARNMVARIESERRTVQHKVASLPRTSVFLDTGFFITVPAHSLPGDILSEGGGKSVADANPGSGPFDVDALHRRNPDFYLVTSDSGISLKDLRKNPRTKDLRAVRDGHFGVVPASYLQPGPDIGPGVLAVAHLLHADAFR